MGLIRNLLEYYKKFSKSRFQNRVQKNLKILKNPKALKEDRAFALDFFINIKEPDIAIPALLERFEYSIENGIVDSREKELAMDGILKFGSQALHYVKEHLKKTTRIAWPIKIIIKIASEQDVINILCDVLNYDDISFDQDAIDKNYDILCYLAEYKISPERTVQLATFLKDTDERVRFAAMEVILNQDNVEDFKNILEDFLLDNSVENRRLKVLAIDTFIKNNWRVSDPKKFEDSKIDEGVYLTKKGKLERRTLISEV